MRKKNQANVELDELVVGYQANPNNDNFEKIYKRIKGYMLSKTYDIETESDAHFLLFRAITTWDSTKNVYFLYYFDLCYRRFRKEMYVYRNNQSRKAEKTISLDQKTKDGEALIAEVIPDPKWNNYFDRKLDKYVFMDFVEKNVESEKDKMVLLAMYENPSVFQTELAKILNVSQAMVHKRIKAMSRKPFSKELYELLKGRA
jgi:hypothetical protein